MIRLNKRLTASMGAVAAMCCLTFTSGKEGLRNDPYQDTGGVWSVCYGQTGVPMHHYSTPECQSMLSDKLATFAVAVSADTPGFATLPTGPKVAAVSLAYNMGIGNYEHSTFRKMLAARELPAACDQIVRYRYVTGHDCSVRSNNCYGVYARRLAERDACRSMQ